MSFFNSYVQIRDAIITLLKNNVDKLNQNLNKPFDVPNPNVIPNRPIIFPQGLSKYPILYVNPLSKTEEFEALGALGRKETNLKFTITGANFLATLGGNADNDESYHLSANVDEILRENIEFSTLVLFSNIESTTFNIDLIKQSATYVSVFQSVLDTRLDVQGIL